MFLTKKVLFFSTLIVCISSAFVIAKHQYTKVDFGNTFNEKFTNAKTKISSLNESFILCSSVCKKDIAFMQSVVFPEVMRYNSLKDDVETESLKTLYVQFGEEYANFSIGLFQMKPTFAQQVEEKAKQLLSDSVYKELQLNYEEKDNEDIRMARVERLQNNEWQLVYLTAFICICDEMYKTKLFKTNIEKLQWYSTIYNTGFDKTDEYINKKIEQENFYLTQGMPKKKFKYAAIASYYFRNNH